MTNSRFTTILFDQGEVILTNDWNFECPEKDELFYSHYHLTESQFNLSRKKYIQSLFTGKITERNYWISTLTDAQASSFDPDFAINLAQKYQTYKLDMEALIQQLYSLGYTLGIISTTHHEMIAYKRRRFNLDRYFKSIITSCDTGLVKPDPRIYQVALKTMKVEPEDCVFIDDTFKNVTAGAKLGIKSIQFFNCYQLRNELAQLGIIGHE